MRAHGGDEEASYSVMSTLLGLSCAEANAAVVCDCIRDMTSVMEQQMETKDVGALLLAVCMCDACAMHVRCMCGAWEVGGSVRCLCVMRK